MALSVLGGRRHGLAGLCHDETARFLKLPPRSFWNGAPDRGAAPMWSIVMLVDFRGSTPLVKSRGAGASWASTRSNVLAAMRISDPRMPCAMACLPSRGCPLRCDLRCCHVSHRESSYPMVPTRAPLLPSHRCEYTPVHGSSTCRPGGVALACCATTGRRPALTLSYRYSSPAIPAHLAILPVWARSMMASAMFFDIGVFALVVGSTLHSS